MHLHRFPFAAVALVAGIALAGASHAAGSASNGSTLRPHYDAGDQEEMGYPPRVRVPAPPTANVIRTPAAPTAPHNGSQ